MNDFLEEVWTIALRHWRKKTKLWDLIYLPLMGLGVFGVGYGIESITSASFYAGRYSSFFSFGVLVYIFFSGALWQGSNIITDSNHFIRLLLVAPISKYAVLFGETLALLVGITRSYLLLGVFFLIMSSKLSLVRMLFIIIYSLYLILTGVAAGLFLSTFSASKEVSSSIANWSSYILLFLSGVIFPVSALPEIAQRVLRLNPFVYIIDLFRFLMLGIGEFPLAVDVEVAVVFGLIIIPLGVYQFDRRLRR
ncbi:hypothetical protein COT48_02080 [Candidatus Woesearchaeota archaeon CG08_land_8_20_14_0_20_47_9]|nr:MAG: hypothetical protein COV22_02135 [Candidatus Woesearchaeota archaeon CG10_big_fil_rev_8_21_14_0_10_47_5]PIO04112.1 MAG: hypothetical protein COT48_02080 [Candidatus Woesearchaeota archaeon CG08_land_8_20_14_0_20_47_9]